MSLKRTLPLVLSFLVLIFVLLTVSLTAHCQTASPGNVSTEQAQQQVYSGMLKACNALAEELAQARKLIQAQGVEIAEGQVALTAGRAKAAKLEELTKLQAQELEQRKLAGDKLQEALAAEQKASEILKQDLIKTRNKLATWRKIGLGAGAVALIILYSAGGR